MILISAEAYEAVRSGDVKRLEAELAREPELARARDASGLSLLMLACYHRKPLIVNRLRQYWPVLDVFEAAALPGDTSEGVRLVRNDPVQAHAWSVDGFTALHLAAYFSNVSMVQALLECGADVHAEARNGTGLQPIHSAVAGRSTEIVRIILNAGADSNATQRGGWTPLHAAAHNGDRPMIELLLSHGADPGARSDDGKLPVDMAVAASHGSVATLLGDPSRFERPASRPVQPSRGK